MMKDIVVPKRKTQLIAPQPKQIRFPRLLAGLQGSDIHDQLEKRDLQIGRLGAHDRQASEMESVAGVRVTEATEALENSVLQFVGGVGDGLFRVVNEEDIFRDMLFDVVEVQNEPSDWSRHWGDL